MQTITKTLLINSQHTNNHRYTKGNTKAWYDDLTSISIINKMWANSLTASIFLVLEVKQEFVWHTILHKFKALSTRRELNHTSLQSTWNLIYRDGRQRLTLTKAMPSACFVTKHSNVRGTRQHCPGLSPWPRTVHTDRWAVDHTVWKMCCITAINR